MTGRPKYEYQDAPDDILCSRYFVYVLGARQCRSVRLSKLYKLGGMSMISQSTKKWQKKVAELEHNNAIEKKERQYAQEKLIRAEAKLERFEGREKEEQHDFVARERRMEDQVEWLRRLVERLVIDPEVMKEESKSELRREQARNESFKRDQRFEAWQRKQRLEEEITRARLNPMVPEANRKLKNY